MLTDCITIVASVKNGIRDYILGREGFWSCREEERSCFLLRGLRKLSI